jgi:hypothetical protein
MKKVLTHRGFLVSDGSGPVHYMDYPDVQTLYHHVETNHNFQDDYDFIEKVIKVAKEVLFDDKGRFILYQQLRVGGSLWVLSFARSTLDFLNGHERKLALENYRDLMVFHPKQFLTKTAEAAINPAEHGWIVQSKPQEIISTWLSKEDGLTDLVMTLQLVGGPLPEHWHESSEANK